MEQVSQNGIPQAKFDELVQQLHKIGEEVVRPNAADVDAKARFPQEGINELKKLKLIKKSSFLKITKANY